MDIYEIRRINVRRIADELGGQAALCRETRRSDSQINQIIGTNPARNIGSKLARSLEKELRLPPDSLDKLPSLALPARNTLPDQIARKVAKLDPDIQKNILALIESIPSASRPVALKPPAETSPQWQLIGIPEKET